MTQEISNWSLTGYFFGVLFILFNAFRYLQTDLSVALVNMLIGVIICGLSFLYNRQLILLRMNSELKETFGSQLTSILNEREDKN